MSGRDRNTGQLSSAMGKIKDKLMKPDDKRAPAHHGYQRVESGDTGGSGGGGGTLSTSTTGTSLDLMIVDETIPHFPLSQQRHPTTTPNRSNIVTGFQPIDDSQRFTPIFEGDDFNEPPIEFIQTQQQLQKHQQYQQQQQQQSKPQQQQQQNQKSSSKSSLKGSRVSFEQKPSAPDNSSDEDSFEDKRDQFQQQRTISGVDHKGILKDLKHMMANDNRKAFQSKKHVSLDVKGTFLEDLLKDSSSDEEFHKIRKDFQGRKHQSLDPRVNFKLEKGLLGQSSTSSDEEGGDDKKTLIQREKRYKDITKPIIVDLRDFDSDDEDFVAARKSFQQQRQISMESKKSLRFLEMDEIGSKKNENLRSAVPFVRQITEDGKPKLEVYRPTTNPIYIWTQVGTFKKKAKD